MSRELAQSLGREPSSHEIAVELGISIDELALLLQRDETPLSLDAPVGDADSAEFGDLIPSVHSATDVAAAVDNISDVKAAFGLLTELEREVLALRFGLLDGSSRTLQSIADERGVSRESIRRVEERAFSRIRKAQKSGKISLAYTLNKDSND